MKIIFSHDVDHLYGKDHWFRDFVYPKLWVRETLRLMKGRINVSEWFGRCVSCFRQKRNQIPELIRFDSEHGIHSTFFFGMNQALGMSYRPYEAKEMIQFVKRKGFDVGVHGICYNNDVGILEEKRQFEKLMGFSPDGIRMHYVRFDNQTFSRLDKAGYYFDSTDFDKQAGICIKDPYKVGSLWEFPVSIMDSYLPYDFESAKQITIDAVHRAEEENIKYFTVLLHDPYFSKEYKAYKKWYEWFVDYTKENHYQFASFKEAIVELEQL